VRVKGFALRTFGVKGFRLGFRVRVKGFGVGVGVKDFRLSFGFLGFQGEGEGFWVGFWLSVEGWRLGGLIFSNTCSEASSSCFFLALSLGFFLIHCSLGKIVGKQIKERKEKYEEGKDINNNEL